MKQQLIELPEKKNIDGHHGSGVVAIDMSQMKNSPQSKEYVKQVDNLDDSDFELSSQNRESTSHQTGRNDLDPLKKLSDDSYSSKRSKMINPGEKSWDKLKIKIVCIILLSLLFGIIFTGVMNYFLAILLSDHISNTTTQEIGKVQIDFTRAMGLHYGNAYVNLIQQETDKTQKVYTQLLSVFSPSTSSSTADFTQIAVHTTLYTDASVTSTNKVTSMCDGKISDMGRIMWQYLSKQNIGITTIRNSPIPQPDDEQIDVYVTKKVLSLFGILRAVKSDIDLQYVNIVLFDQYSTSQLYFSFPSRDITKATSPDLAQAMAANLYSKANYEMYKSRYFFDYNYQEKYSCPSQGASFDLIFVTDCIAILCSDLSYKTQVCNSTPPNTDPRCLLNDNDFCGSICTFYSKYTLSFLQSLQGKGINHVYVTQVSDQYTEKQIYTPLVFLDFQSMKVHNFFWNLEFGVNSYTNSADAQAFYNNFDRFYKDVSDEQYLATSSFSNGNDEYQISIISIKQKFNSNVKQLSTSQETLAFTAVTKIPQSSEIFQSTITDIKNSMNNLLIIGIVVLVILCIVITLYIYRYSDHVTQPINLLQDRVKQIARGQLDVNVQNDTNKHWEEIDILFKNFEFLNQIVISGDDKFYTDLSAESLIKYSNAFVMFDKLDNRKGKGIVLNNIGNINMKLGRIEEAINSYKESFQLAERDLLELLLIDNIFAYYKVKPFGGWDPTKKYDFSYNYHFYTKMVNRPHSLLVCTANKSLYESVIANRSYQLARAYLQGYYMNTNEDTRQSYLSNCIDYFRLTEQLDAMHNQNTSRAIFTKLKLCQALIEKAGYFNKIKDIPQYKLMYFQSLIYIDRSNDSLLKYEQMYNLFDENFKYEIPPEILKQHCTLQQAITNREFHKFRNAITEFTSCLRQGKHYDPQVREQCLHQIKEILEQEKLLEKAPGLMKLIQNNFEKKWKDIVIIVDFSFSMNHKIHIPAEEFQSQFLDQNIIGDFQKRVNIDKYRDADGNVSQKNIAIYKFLQIFDDFVQNNDRVAFIRFNENVDVIFELNEKGNNTRFLRNSIESQFKVEPIGESAIRQSIYTAIKLFQKTIPKDHSKWIVIFTDGGDSCSQISEPGLMKILSESDLNIMIIGCGLDKYATKIFRQYCEKTKNGIFIKANNRINEINIAFQAITNKLYGNNDLHYNVEAFNVKS